MPADLWTKVTDIAQILTTVLTGGAVIYAAKQIVHSAKVQRTAQYQAAVNMMFAWRSEIITNDEIAARWADPARGSTYFREVIQKYGAANYFHTVKLFHVFEFLHILQREKIITDKMWDGWKNNLLKILEGSDISEIWKKLQEVGTPLPPPATTATPAGS